MTDDIPPEVMTEFERLAIRVRDSGFRRYSADAILHRIRWEMSVERGNREFKVNDHWSAPLARWFLGQHPDFQGFFKLRKTGASRLQGQGVTYD